MRRLLSLVLLAAFGLPLIAPTLALGQDPDAGLPACCRRNGAHHCSMGRMQRESSTVPTVSERCTSFPQPSNAPSQISSAALLATANSVAFNFFASAAQQQANTQRRISRARSHHKRGPPAFLLA